MAGHSKFKNIMHRKGAQDKKRSAMFSKLSREITVAAKMGLPDPDMNARLRAAVLAAKAQSMPKDNIQRSIDKASAGDAENYEEIRYEGFGPGGVCLIVEALTDNRNRTATNVRTIFSKNGGNLGACGSVSHGFDRMGLIEYPGTAGDEERCSKPRSRPVPTMSKATRTATKSGPRMDSLHAVAKRSRRRARRGRIGQARLEAAERGHVTGDDAATLMKLIDALEDDDDVQTVWGNYESPTKSWRSSAEADPRPRPRPGTTGWGLIRAEGNRLSHLANGQLKTDAAEPCPSACLTSPRSLRRSSPISRPMPPRSRKCSSTRTRNRRSSSARRAAWC